jgi:adenylate cyclase
MKTEPIKKEDVLNQVARICRSPEFKTKQVLCRFLSYIVSETLAGRGAEIKAFSIGVDVFNKDEDFDPGQDTLVRINAIRLRRMLEMYYNKSGVNDDIIIEIPKGGYLPSFIARVSLSPKAEPALGSDAKKVLLLEPSIAVLSFKDLSGTPKNQYFAKGFSYELLVELSKYEDLKVFNYLSVTDHPENDSLLYASMAGKGIRFTFGGAVHMDKERVNVLVHLHDLHEGRQIWSERYSEKTEAENFIEIQETIVREVSGKLGSEYGIILQRLTQDAKRQKPQSLNTYSAILKYYHYLSSRSPESASDAFNALKQAVENDPDSAMALASLAALHGTAYAMDLPGAEKSYTAAGELAEKAYSLDPYNLFVQIVLTFKYFIFNEKELFFDFSDQILKKNPKSTLRLGSLGFHLALYGDWKRGKQILDSVINGHLEYPLYFHGATSCYFFKTKSYEEALKEANKYQLAHFFWGPMLRAAALGQLNRKKEAATELEHLKRLKPDFEQKAFYLISRFLKEESLVTHLIEGLRKAGMAI